MFYSAVHRKIFVVFSSMSMLVHSFWKLFASISNASDNPANMYLFKVNNRNTWTTCEICSKLIKHQNDVSVFIVYFEHISHLFLLFLLWSLNIGRPSLHFLRQCKVMWERFVPVFFPVKMQLIFKAAKFFILVVFNILIQLMIF